MMEFGDKPRVDEELSQAKARVLVTVVALLYLGGLALFAVHPPGRLLVGLLLAYLLLACGWILWVRRRPQAPRYRLILGISGDLALITFTMQQLGAPGAIFYPLHLRVIVANGIRFGGLYLILSTALSSLAFLVLLFTTPYWQDNLAAWAGLGLGLVLLPTFYFSLIQRLHLAKDALEAQLAKARDAERAKEDFLANMTHELRTPLNGVLGVARLLRGTRLGGEQQHYVSLMERSANFLLHIIEEILDFSQITRDRIELAEAPLDFKALLDEVLLLAGAIPEEKDLTVRLVYPEGAPRDFLGDPLRLRQIFFNLVGNAMKFTPQGTITVRCGFGPPVDESMGTLLVVVEVEDTGIGIEEDKLPTIFEQFQQADSRYSRRFRGAGLGLSISRQLARSMGGDIRVTSRPEQGSTFTVELALKLDPEPPDVWSETGPVPVQRDYGMRALIVEDDPTSQLVARMMLESVGISTEIAATGVQALDRYRSGAFDFMLMDMQMPEMDGLEATREIRKLEPPGYSIPIIALTANVSDKDVELCIDAGMTAHLQKPMLVEDLVSLLDFLIENGDLVVVQG